MLQKLPRTFYFCVLNFKGGVGKTSTAIHLAYYFSVILGLKILLVDCDFQANASSGLLKEIESPTLTDVIKGEVPLHKAIRPAREDCLYLLPSDPDLDKASKHIVSSGMGGYTLLRSSLELLEKGKQLREFDKKETFTGGDQYHFDVVIFDNAGLTPVTESAMYASEAMLIPVEMEYFSFEGLYVMKEKLDETMSNMRHELDVLGIIPYNIDERFKMTRDYSQLIRKDFQTEVTPAIRTDATVKYAQSHAQTVFEYDVNCHAAEDFARLGDVLFQRIQDSIGGERR